MRRDHAPARSQADAIDPAQVVVEQLRDQWRKSPQIAQLLVGLQEYARGYALHDCAALAECLSSTSIARHLLKPLFAAMGRALRDHPLAHVPLRHQFAHGVSVLELMRAGQASLSLVVYDGAVLSGRAASPSIAFSDEERHEICLAGSGRGRVVTMSDERHDRVALHIREIAFHQGCVLELDRTSSRLVDAVEGHLAILRLTRSPERPRPVREFALADGRLLHCASGNRRDSRAEMAVALLGRMGRRDAVRPLANIVREEDNEHLRWQALRNAIALDSAIGLAVLEEMAGKAGDALSVPAAKLHRQLLDKHPGLTRCERQPCLA